MDNLYSSLPGEPEKRRVILVLSESGFKNLDQESYTEPSIRRIIANDQISLLNIDALMKEDIKNNPLINKLKGSKLLNPGSMLIQSPYDSSIYANSDVASYKFAQEKCVLFAELCGYLAAKKVSATNLEIKNTETQNQIKLDINSPYVDGGGQAETRAWKEMKKRVDINETYPRQDPNLEAAEAFIQQFQFLSDPYINSLFRRRKSGIIINTSRYNLSITEESKQNLDLAFSLNIPSQVGFKVDFQKIEKEYFEFSVEYKVEFWS